MGSGRILPRFREAKATPGRSPAAGQKPRPHKATIATHGLHSVKQAPERGAVGVGNAGVSGDIRSGFQQTPVTVEVFDQIAAVLKAVHDVGEMRCVLQTERVPAFVQAGQINDGVAQKAVRARFRVGQDVDDGSLFAIDVDRLCFAVKPHVSAGPADADARVSFGGALLHNDRAVRFALPCFEGPCAEFGIARLAARRLSGFFGARVHPPGV